MTTYTFTGFSVRYNQNEDPVAVNSATLAITFPNSLAFINYSVINASDLPEVDLGGTSPQRLVLNGASISGDFFDESSLGNLTASSGTTTFLSFYNEASNTDYLFRIGGAAFTPPTSVAQFNALNNSITGLGIASGALGPNRDILISSLAGVQTSNTNAPSITINGTNGDDLLEGTVNNDNIITRNATPAGDTIFGSIGNDTIDMRGNDGANGLVLLDYTRVDAAAMIFTINGVTSTGSVNKFDAGTDTLLGVAQPMNAGFVNGALGLTGSAGNDTFNITTQQSQWMVVRGDQGADTYNISGAGEVRLNFNGSPGNVSVNLATGVVANDGFGNVETITGNVWELQGGAGNDTLIGSNANESFIGEGGNNYIDGGGGFDRVRYDRGGITSGVLIDLSTGTASGRWQGNVFVDTLVSIEAVRGSNLADTIIGSAADERFEGRGGTDTFVYNGGNDTIRDFDFSAETVIFDIGLTEQQITAALQAASLTGQNTVTASFGAVGSLTFSNASVAQVRGIEVAMPSNDIVGTTGQDTLIGTDGDDRIRPIDNTSFDLIFPGLGNDVIDFSETVTGFMSVIYDFLDDLGQSITVDIDGAANTGRVVYSGGDIDTFIDVANPLNAGWTTGGFEILGTAGGDTFRVAPGFQQWMTVRMGDGVDSLIVNGAGQVRVDFRDATENVNINLASRAILNDGFGNAETIGGSSSIWEVVGSATGVTFVGSAADESYRATGGNDDLDGGAGFDRVRFQENNITSVDIDAESGVVIGIANGNVFETQINGFENYIGSNGNDTVRGTLADERFDMRGGVNTFIHTGGNDTIASFVVGVDTLVVRNNATRAEVDAALQAGVDDGNGGKIVTFANGSSITFRNMDFADLYGLVTISGGRTAGNTYQGTGVRDVMNGSDGDDTINAGNGLDEVYGGDGNDDINAGFGSDVVYGGEGNDVIRGLDGFDTLYGGYGHDTLDGNAGNDVMFGNSGNDVLRGGIGADTLYGEAGDDFIGGNDGFDRIYGDTGNDTLEGNNGNDLVFGGRGDDLLDGGFGFDTLHGDEGNDLILGRAGFDQLFGGAGDDRLDGGSGNDIVDGGTGNDILRGGAGADTFVFRLGYEQDRIIDFTRGVDILHIDRGLMPQANPVANDLRAFSSLNADGFVVLDFGNGDTLTFTGITNTNAILDTLVFV